MVAGVNFALGAIVLGVIAMGMHMLGIVAVEITTPSTIILIGIALLR